MQMDVESGIGQSELLQVADAVAREKGIDRDTVLEAMEQAISHAGKRKYGQEHDIRATIDRTNGTIEMMRFIEVAAEIEDPVTQVTLDEAQARKPDAEIGEFLTEPLPPIDFGRIAAQTAKQVIVQRVREAERERQFGEYKDRVGEIVNGLVKRVEYGNVMADLGRAEALLRREEMLPPRIVPPRRSGARLRARRTRGAARPADLPVAHASAVHGQAVRPGSARNLRSHHRDQGGRARSGQPRQDSRVIERFEHRPRRRLRRHARQPRSGGGRRVTGREDRHHPMVGRPGDLRRQRAGAGRGDQGGARRRCQQDRGRRGPTISSASASGAAARMCVWRRS